MNIDRLEASQLGRVERDEDVADQTSLVAGQTDGQSGPTILRENGAPASIHVSDLPLAALPPDMRSAQCVEHVLAFKDPGGSDCLAARVRRQTNVRRQERGELCVLALMTADRNARRRSS